MKIIEIGANEAGQRLDRFLMKYMDKVPKGFIQKMIRKKRIKVNHKKIQSNYHLKIGDQLQLYLAEETIDNFKSSNNIELSKEAIEILYEDDNILIVNKNKNTLTHGEGNSLINRALNYLIESGSYNREENETFTPAACNRLDRNTTGIVIIGKNFKALREINNKIKNGYLDKYYLTIVKGQIRSQKTLKGFWTRDGSKVKITPNPTISSGKEVITEIIPLKDNGEVTLLKIKLVTGRTHQIRAHLQSIDHPIIGDPKYGDSLVNKYYNLNNQLLHAYEISIKGYAEGEDLQIIAPLQKCFKTLLDKSNLGSDNFGILG